MSRIPPQGARIVGAWPPPPERHRPSLKQARVVTDQSQPEPLRSRDTAPVARGLRLLRLLRKGRPRTV